MAEPGSWMRRSKLRRSEVVLSATIDYDHQRRKQGMSLRPGRPENESNQGYLESEVQRILTDRLPAELEEIYGFEVKTRIIAVRRGSLVVFFGAAVAALGFFSSYSDFFESIALVKKHAKMLLHQQLEDRFGGDYDVSIEVAYPRIPDPDDFPPWRRARKMFGPELDEVLGASGWAAAGRPPHGDAFFWFLLVSTVVLLALLGMLVGAAVWKTYFA